MNLKIQYFILLNLLFIATLSFSQNNCNKSTIIEADKKYKTGNFNEVINTLNNCNENGFEDDDLLIESYRLIAKSYIALDNDSSANVALKELLKIEPKFQANTLNDPPKLFELIAKIKKTASKVTITSISKKAENINEAPATAIMISQEKILRRGYNDIEAMLHDLPGFDISRSNGNMYSHIYQRGYRSINTNRTLFLVDGVEENDLWSSNVYLSRQYTMSNIKNVEVLYGPTSTMYGSNAFLGVVNIVTKEPGDYIKQGKLFGMDMRTGYGSYNTKYFDGTIAAKTKNNKISFSISSRVFLSNEQDLSEYTQHDYEPGELTDDLTGQYHALLDITNDSLVNVFLEENPSSHNLYTLTDDNQIILTDEGIQQAYDFDNEIYRNTTFVDRTEAFSFNLKLKIYDFLIGYSYWNKAEGPGSQYNDMIFMTYEQGMSWRPVHNYFYIKFNKDINIKWKNKKTNQKLNISNFLRYKVHDFNQDNCIVIYTGRYAFGSYSLQDLLLGTTPALTKLYLYQKSNQIRNEFKVLYQPHKKFDIVAGFESRFSAIQGDYSLGTDHDAEETSGHSNIPGGNHLFSRDLGFYAQGSLELLKISKLFLGMRYDNNLIRETQGYGGVFNPRLALVLTPGSFVFKLIYAEAFKDATNKEKFSTAEGKRELSNPFLQPEKVKNYEFSTGKKFGENCFINASFYFSNYSNIIQEVQVQLENGSYTNQNQPVGNAQVYGINAYADWDFIITPIHEFSIYSNYTYTEPYIMNPTEDDGSPKTDENGNPYERLRISDIANHQINFGTNYAFKKSLNINLRANYVGKRITGINTTVPTNTETFEPYVILNGSLSYTMRKYGLTFQYSVFNIIGTEYFSPGLDEANGSLASKLIQNKRNMYFSLIFKL